jgi:hypothetical protein
MEVVGVVFIANNHFLVVAFFLLTTDGPCPWSRRSMPLVRTVCPCTSMAEITTDNSNSYINGYKCIKCVVRCQIKLPRTVRLCTTDGPAVHHGRSARTPKMHFTEPVTFRFFWFFNKRTVCA